MEQPIIALQNGVVRDESRRFRTPVNFTLEAGEHIAVMGLNGSGKKILKEGEQGNFGVFLQNMLDSFEPMGRFVKRYD